MHDTLELARTRAWDALAKKCTDADILALTELATLLSWATGPLAQVWLLRIAEDKETAERVCVLLATAIAELRVRREETKETCERN